MPELAHLHESGRRGINVSRLTPAAPGHEIAGSLNAIALGLWWLGLAISPIYLFAPGTPQLTDVAMAGSLMFVLVARPAIDKDLMLLGGLWLGYATIVNLTWWCIIPDDRFLWSMIYNIFNFGMMCAVVSWLAVSPDKFIRYSRIAIVVALVFQIFFVVILSAGRPRAMGLFENPNQLGYWALLIGATWFLLKPREPLGLVDFGVILITDFCAFQSASRGGLGGALILTLVVFFFFGISKRHIPVLALLTAAMAVVLVATSDNWLPGISEHTAIDRLDKDGKHDSFAGRGYDRLWLYPQYVLQGSGQGAYWRFGEMSEGGSNEIHSTFATMLFSYGLFGTVLFAMFLWHVFRHAELHRIALFAPLAFYGLTHMGLRQTLLWVCLGLVAGIGRLRRQACDGAR